MEIDQKGVCCVLKSLLKKGLLLLLVVGLYYGVFGEGSQILHKLTPEKIKMYLESYGALAPIIYILLFTFVPLTFFPDALLAIAAGMVFGFMHGTIYTMIGAVCGGTLAFYITRYLSHEVIKQKVNAYQKMGDMIDKNGVLIVMILRFIPLIPFDVISYSAGATRIKYRDYILGTLIGIIPGVVLLVMIGDGLSTPEQPKLYLAGVLFILLIVFASKAKARLFKEDVQEIKLGESN